MKKISTVVSDDVTVRAQGQTHREICLQDAEGALVQVVLCDQLPDHGPRIARVQESGKGLFRGNHMGCSLGLENSMEGDCRAVDVVGSEGARRQTGGDRILFSKDTREGPGTRCGRCGVLLCRGRDRDSPLRQRPDIRDLCPRSRVGGSRVTSLCLPSVAVALEVDARVEKIGVHRFPSARPSPAGGSTSCAPRAHGWENSFAGEELQATSAAFDYALCGRLEGECSRHAPDHGILSVFSSHLNVQILLLNGNALFQGE